MANVYTNPKCYARELGNCSSKISTEHYLSRELMNWIELFGVASTAGIHWKASDKADVPLANWFGAKILCTTHNSILSALDMEALNFFKSMKGVDTHLDKSKDKNPARFRVSGDRLERWFLKALCGFIVSGNARLGAEKVESDPPPLAWLQLLYGTEQMPPGWGLYCQNRPQEFVPVGASLGFATLINYHKHVVGFIMELAGFRFLLAMRKPDKQDPGDLLEGATFHPTRFAFIVPGSPQSASIDFEWSGGPGRGIFTINWQPK